MAKFDPAHKATDKEIEKLEKAFRKEYKTAYRELDKKLKDYMDGFKSRDSQKQADVKSGKITQKQYQEWRKNQMLTGKRWEQMRDTMAMDLVHADETARALINGAVPEVFANNANWATYSLEHQSRIDTSFTLYNHEAVEKLLKDQPDILPRPRMDIPKDKRWNKQKLTSALTQGILQGESIDKLSKRLRSVTDMDENAAVRNARTMMTGAQNAGRETAYERAQNMGIGIKRAWMATLDSRTRESHIHLDGEIRALDEPFSNGCMFPGDPSGEPSEVYNCRCRTVPEYDKYHTDWSNLELRNNSKLGQMTYEEWKHSKDKPQKVTEKTTEEKLKELLEQSNPDIYEAGKLLAEIMHDKQKPNPEIQESINALKEERDNVDFETDYIIVKQALEYVSELRKIKIGLSNEDSEEIMRGLDWALKDLGLNKDDFFTGEYFDMFSLRNALIDKRKVFDLKISELDAQIRTMEDKLSPHYYDSAKNLKDTLSQYRKMGTEGLEQELKDHLVGRSPVKKFVEQAYSYYPSDWLEKSFERGTLQSKKVDRGYYDDWNNVIAISSWNGDNGSFETAVHELGHRFEQAVPDIKAEEAKFYKRRTDGENLEWMGEGYARNEVTRKDDFIHPYMGKDYKGYAYELVSMGFEYAYCQPEKLAKDADMESWIYGLLLTQ